MMKTIIIFHILGWLMILQTATAQKPTSKSGYVLGFTANAGQGSFASAFAWSHYYPLGAKKRFHAGYGLRLTNFFGSDLDYQTAPAKYTSGKASIAALFTESIEANIDTVSFVKSQINSFNAGIYFNYLLPFWKDKIELGVNIDVVGFSLGVKQEGMYLNNSVTAKPTPLNLLLISDSDIGSLNSEWYVSYWASPKIALKLGYEFLFSEYTTTHKIQQIPGSTETNDRFRAKSRMLLLGISYSPFRK